MLNVLGEKYHIDFQKIEDLIAIQSTGSGDTEQNVSIVKFELIKTMLDVVFSEMGEIDEKMGLKGANDLTIPFKIAFNTLLRYGIIQTI
jgi:hypothetical protein